MSEIKQNYPNDSLAAGIVVITPSQLRAARALLDWSRKECGEALGISSETIKNVECGRYRPSSETIERIVRSFSSKGIEFTGQRHFRGVVFLASELTEVMRGQK